MDSSIDSNNNELPHRGATSKDKDELKHIQENVELMRNRVHLLRHQLQKEKDNINKHKTLTKDVVQQKIEYNKLNSIVQ
jgi:citrate synthase